VKLSRSKPPGSAGDEAAEAFQTTRAGSHGAFRLDGIPPGTYDIEIASPGFHSFLQHETEVRAGEKVNLGRIVLVFANPCGTSAPYQPPSIELRALPPGGTRVSGYAYDPRESTRSQLPGISVVLTTREKNRKTFQTKTNREGQFVFDSVPPGSYTLRASLRGRASIAVDEVPVKAGQETVIERFPMGKCRFFGFCGTHRRFRQSLVCE